ncbi:MAG: dolichyl-phosphate beta-glucosyltransferase [Bacteroidia bacterium]|jgi:glycosyltransferase involved in cell wall biosynthesis
MSNSSPHTPASSAPAAEPFVTFVVPVYNEEPVLGTSLPILRDYLDLLVKTRDKAETWELVLVDDGSKDRSVEMIEAWIRDEQDQPGTTRLLLLPENRGKGAAVRKGMLEAAGRYVFFLDADLSTPLEETPGFLAALESGYEVVLGNRRVPGAQITRRQPRLRQTLGRCFTMMVNLALAPGVQDFTCGFKGFEREAAATIFQRSTLDGWAFDAELVVIAQTHGLQVVQLPVTWHHEDDTKVRLLAAVFGSLRDLLTITKNRLSGRYK